MAVKKAFGFVRDCVEKYIPSIALAALFIIFCYQVFMRYVLRQPQAWAGEVEQSCFLWLVLLGAGLAAAGGQFSITAAYKFAPAKEISVYDYSQIIFSALLGFILFSQLPDIWSFIGYVIICGVGIAMFFYNNRKDK